MTSLREKGVKGFFWSSADKVGNHSLQFILGIILARLLSPSDYGLIGMITIFIALAQTFVDSGFTVGLIRQKEFKAEAYSTVFWYNLAVSVIFYLLLYIAAPYIAKFYSEPQLINLVRVICISIIILAIGSIQRTLYVKKMDFQTSAIINLVSILISGGVGIFLALKNYGVWALVVQNILKVSVVTMAFWFVSDFRPGLRFSSEIFRKLFSFGARLLGANLINTFFENIYLLVIGKIFSASGLGFYTRARQFQTITVGTFYSIISSVTFPMLSEVQDNNLRMTIMYRRLIRFSTLFIFPALTILGFTAPSLVKVLLTEKWMPAVPFIQILCLAGSLYPVHALNINILNVLGRSDLVLRLELAKKSILVLIIFITYRFGLLYLVWGQVIYSLIALVINTYYTGKVFGYGIKIQLRDISRSFYVSSILYCVLKLVLILNLTTVAELVSLTLTGIVGAFILAYIIITTEDKVLIGELVKSMLRQSKS